MSIITEEMRYRKRLCEYAKKHGVSKAARKYHTNRQFVYRQLEKYDGTLISLALKSRRPHSHPNAHTEEELNLIKQVKSRYGIDGLAEVYVQLRKRVLEIVDEKSVTNTTRFVKKLEKIMGLEINTIQTDNGPEFVNNQVETKEQTIFEKTLESLGINHRRTRPYSPWQNGKVERSHKIDGERFYSRNEFSSVEDLKKKLKRYNARYNNISKKVLGFKSPNQIVEEYKLNCTIA